MFTLGMLQDRPDTSLTWLFDVLIAFMVVVIVIGSLVGSRLREQGQKSQEEEGKSAIKAEPSSNSKLTPKVKRPRSKRWLE